MSRSIAQLLAIGIASVGVATVGITFAGSQRAGLDELAHNEGILVDVKTFKIVKGKAKSDPSAQIVKLGARPVAEGAIVFRTGDKLYIADGNGARSPACRLHCRQREPSSRTLARRPDEQAACSR